MPNKRFSGVFPKGLFPASEEMSCPEHDCKDGEPILNDPFFGQWEKDTAEIPVFTTEEAIENLRKGITK